jgi:hypothetical protein
MAASCIYAEELDYFDAPNRETPDEIRWANRKKTQAVWRMLLPFLIVEAVILVLLFFPKLLNGGTWSDRFHSELHSLSIPAILVQGMLLLVFPGLFVVEAGHARDLIARRNPAGKTTKEEQAKRERLVSSPLFVDEMCYLRARYFLAVQSQLRFWRRLGFAVLLGLWSVLFFCTMDTTKTKINTSQGASTWASLLSYEMSGVSYNSPVMAAGFAGFYIYALTALIYRHRTGNVTHQMLVTLLIRGMTSILICAAIALVSGDQPHLLATTAAFLVGIVPDNVIKAITNIAAIPMGQFTIDSTSGFRALPAIGLWKAVSLAELGTDDVHELATADLTQLLVRVGINPIILVQAVDRAILIEVFSSTDRAIVKCCG